MSFRRSFLLAAALASVAMHSCPAGSAAAGAGFLPVDDPLVAELRVLELYEPAPGWPARPHGHALPMRWDELGAPPADLPLAGARGIALRRLARAAMREWPGAPAVPGATARWFTRDYPDGSRLTLSAALEGALAREADSSAWADGSGLHVRAGFSFGRWHAFSHLWAGRLAGVRAFSDALVAESDLAVTTEESGILWSSAAGPVRADAALARSRWHWGPGEEGSLLLSRTSAALTGFQRHVRIEPLRADFFALDATVAPGSGEQLAAHRVEWQPRPWLRLGAAEAARYRSDGWLPLYVLGVVPYSIVQRLLDQDSPGTPEANRNNVLVSCDASLRVADGTRVYGELLVDDLHAKSAAFPNKYAWQAGWDGAGAIGGTRVTWNAEYTRLSRWVYTSYYGRAHASQDRPLGFPTGPGSRRLRLRVTGDSGRDLQCSLFASRTERGTEGLADAFVPGSPAGEPEAFAGVRETTRTLEGELRWWPATGLDVAARAGREWRDGAGHVAGAMHAHWRGAFALRLTR